MSESKQKLNILCLLRNPEQAQLFLKVLREAGDECEVTTDLERGLAHSQQLPPDLAFIDVGLDEGAGLAMVHHVRAANPRTRVIALAHPRHLSLASQAMGLGATALLELPASGDALLTMASLIREEIDARSQQEQLSSALAISRRALTLVGRMAELLRLADRNQAAVELAHIFQAATSAEQILVYLPASQRMHQLRLVYAVGEGAGFPSFCEEADLRRVATEAGYEALRLSAGARESGLVLLGFGAPRRAELQEDAGLRELLKLLAAQAATSLALLAEREGSELGAIKDPESSAYSFAYFVDIAGREIDKARRYFRCFALGALTLEGDDALGELRPQSAALVEDILAEIRGADVLARVDTHEFHLLLPETDGIGGQVFKQRLQKVIGGRGRLGVAAYPHDGGDLPRLLRVAKRRAEASRSSSVHALADLSLKQLLESLQRRAEASSPAGLLEAVYPFDLSRMDLLGLASAVASQATRAGRAKVWVSHATGVSLGFAVQAQLKDRPGIEINRVDLSDEPELQDFELLLVLAEYGSYALLGQCQEGAYAERIIGVHSADPLLLDALVERLSVIQRRSTRSAPISSKQTRESGSWRAAY